VLHYFVFCLCNGPEVRLLNLSSTFNRSQVQIPASVLSSATLGKLLFIFACASVTKQYKNSANDVTRVHSQLSEGSLVRGSTCPKGHLSEM